MLLINLFSSLLLASTIYATICPNYWWPLNPNNKFTSDVVSGYNINYYSKVLHAPDRLGTPTAITATTTGNINAAFFSGQFMGGAAGIAGVPGVGLAAQGNAGALHKFQQSSYAQLPPGAYFSGTTFTITFWINQLKDIPSGTPGAPAAAVRILDFSINSINAATRTAFGVAICFGRFINFYAASAAATDSPGATQSATALTAGAWAHVALSCTVTTSTVCLIYVSTSTTLGTATSSTLANVIPSTGTYFYNYIGASTYTAATEGDLNTFINDVKIFNSALTSGQLQTQLTAEAAARTYTCSSTSISPQYFYIALLAMLGAFL